MLLPHCPTLSDKQDTLLDDHAGLLTQSQDGALDLCFTRADVVTNFREAAFQFAQVIGLFAVGIVVQQHQLLALIVNDEAAHVLAATLDHGVGATGMRRIIQPSRRPTT